MGIGRPMYGYGSFDLGSKGRQEFHVRSLDGRLI